MYACLVFFFLNKNHAHQSHATHINNILPFVIINFIITFVQRPNAQRNVLFTSLCRRLWHLCCLLGFGSVVGTCLYTYVCMYIFVKTTQPVDSFLEGKYLGVVFQVCFELTFVFVTTCSEPIIMFCFLLYWVHSYHFYWFPFIFLTVLCACLASSLCGILFSERLVLAPIHMYIYVYTYILCIAYTHMHMYVYM